MTRPFEPMLAATVKDVDKLTYPLMASPKLDGVRAIVKDGLVLSRRLKPLPNEHVQRLFGKHEGFDGELILGPPQAKDVFTQTLSAVKRAEGKPEVTFWVFDCFTAGASLPFKRRYEQVVKQTKRHLMSATGPVHVPHYHIASKEELLFLENSWVTFGYEGMMLRHPEGGYKYGRSTFKEGTLLKFKRFEDAEARVVGFEELMHNANETVTNELGRPSRSTKKEGLEGRGTLGSLIVVGVNGQFKDATFNIGSGFSGGQRAEIWANRKSWDGRVVKYKYFAGGSKDAPRFPVFLGERTDGL